MDQSTPTILKVLSLKDYNKRDQTPAYLCCYFGFYSKHFLVFINYYNCYYYDIQGVKFKKLGVWQCFIELFIKLLILFLNQVYFYQICSSVCCTISKPLQGVNKKLYLKIEKGYKSYDNYNNSVKNSLPPPEYNTDIITSLKTKEKIIKTISLLFTKIK